MFKCPEELLRITVKLKWGKQQLLRDKDSEQFKHKCLTPIWHLQKVEGQEKGEEGNKEGTLPTVPSHRLSVRPSPITQSRTILELKGQGPDT